MYRFGHKRAGVLSRQPAENMLSYIRRRRRWWSQLKSLGPKIEMSPVMIADILESSGLNENQQLMTLTSIINERDFELIADDLNSRMFRVSLWYTPDGGVPPTGGTFGFWNYPAYPHQIFLPVGPGFANPYAKFALPLSGVTNPNCLDFAMVVHGV